MWSLRGTKKKDALIAKRKELHKHLLNAVAQLDKEHQLEEDSSVSLVNVMQFPFSIDVKRTLSCQDLVSRPIKCDVYGTFVLEQTGQPYHVDFRKNVDVLIPTACITEPSTKEFFVSEIHARIQNYRVHDSGACIELQKVAENYLGRALLIFALLMKPELSKTTISSTEGEGITIVHSFKMESTHVIHAGDKLRSLAATLRHLSTVELPQLFKNFSTVKVDISRTPDTNTIRITIHKSKTETENVADILQRFQTNFAFLEPRRMMLNKKSNC